MQCHISLCFSSVRALQQSGQQERDREGEGERGRKERSKEMLREIFRRKQTQRDKKSR